MPKKADKIRKQMLRIARKSESKDPTEEGRKKWKFMETFHTPRKAKESEKKPESEHSQDKIKIPGTAASIPDPKTGKPSMAMCLKGKRHASRGEKNNNIQHQCIKSMAETELNIDGSKSIKKLILE